MNEVQFLNRVFDLKSLPSTDYRYKDTRGDVLKHMIMNRDWPDDWFCNSGGCMAPTNSSCASSPSLCFQGSARTRGKDFDIVDVGRCGYCLHDAPVHVASRGSHLVLYSAQVL